jgi:urease accessory protein
MDLWLVLQVADSAFPVGGFAHSGGLEAAVQLGEVVDGRGLDRFACAAMWQAGYGALPILGAAYDGPDDVARLDAHHDAFLTGTVANRASRTQGRTFVAACARIFEAPAIVALEEAARADRLRAHLAPMFGATMRALAVARADALTISRFAPSHPRPFDSAWWGRTRRSGFIGDRRWASIASSKRAAASP